MPSISCILLSPTPHITSRATLRISTDTPPARQATVNPEAFPECRAL
jgi:hypothetical protein